MPWYIRRSVKVGPIRFNISRRGIGTSVGVKGARVGVSADGRPYVAGGRGGLYYRQYYGRRVQRQATPAPRSLPTGVVTAPPAPPVPLRVLPGLWLGVLVVAYVVGLVLGFAATDWPFLLVGVNVALAATDWHGYWSLGGLVRRWSFWRVVGVIALACMFFITPGIVLAREVLAWRADARERPQRLQDEIARLEHELGIDDAPNGGHEPR